MSKLIRIGGARVENIHGIGKTVRNRPFDVKDETQYKKMVVQTSRFVTPEEFAKKPVEGIPVNEETVIQEDA